MFQWFIRFSELHWISLPFRENSIISFFVNFVYFIACNLIRPTEATGWNRQHKSVKLNGNRHSFIAQMKTNNPPDTLLNKKRMFSCHFGEECVSEFRVTITTWPRRSGIKLRLAKLQKKKQMDERSQIGSVQAIGYIEVRSPTEGHKLYINACQLYPHSLLWNIHNTLTVITGSSYAHHRLYPATKTPKTVHWKQLVEDRNQFRSKRIRTIRNNYWFNIDRINFLFGNCLSMSASNANDV